MEQDIKTSYSGNGTRRIKLTFLALISALIIGFLLTLLFGDKLQKRLYPEQPIATAPKQNVMPATPAASASDLSDLSEKVTRNTKFDTYQEERLTDIAQRLEKKAETEDLKTIKSALDKVQTTLNTPATTNTPEGFQKKLSEFEERLSRNIRGDTFQEERIEMLTRDFKKQNEQLIALADSISQKVIAEAKPALSGSTFPLDLADRVSNVVRSNTAQEERLAKLESQIEKKSAAAIAPTIPTDLTDRLGNVIRSNTAQEERLAKIESELGKKSAPALALEIPTDLTDRLGNVIRSNTAQEERLAKLESDISKKPSIDTFNELAQKVANNAKFDTYQEERLVELSNKAIAPVALANIAPAKPNTEELNELSARLALAIRINTSQEERLENLKNELENSKKSPALSSKVSHVEERLAIAMRANTLQEEQLANIKTQLNKPVSASSSNTTEIEQRLALALRKNTEQEQRLYELEQKLANNKPITDTSNQVSELKDKLSHNAKFDTFQEERLVTLENSFKALQNTQATAQSLPVNSTELSELKLRFDSSLKTSTLQELRLHALENKMQQSATIATNVTTELELRLNANIKTDTEQELRLSTLDKKIEDLQLKSSANSQTAQGASEPTANNFVQKEELEALSLRLQNMQRAPQNSTDNQRIGALLSLVQAALTGNPFQREITQAKEAGINHASLAVLEKKAPKGTTTEKKLDKVLNKALNQLPLLPQSTINEHLLTAKPKISPKDTTSILSSMVAFLKEGDIANALDAAYALPEKEREVLAPWINASNDKLVVERALINLQKEALTANP